MDPHAQGLRTARGTLLVFSSASLAAFAACRTPAEFASDADREVYEIVRARRDELAAGGEFSIVSTAPSMRDRLLEGEAFEEPLDLFACIAVAAENSRDFQTRRETLYLEALDLTLAEWDFSVQQNGSFGAFLDRRGSNDTSAGLLSNLGLTRLLGTGMQVIGNVGVDFVRDIGRADGWDAVSNLSLNITQPLLRGFGRDVVRNPLTQAERDVLYAARAYERFRRTFAFDVASRFFRILRQTAVLENERQNQAGLVLLRERNEAFAEAGLLNDIQVDQARQNELQARNRVIEAQRQLQALLDDFKLFLGLPITFDLRLDEGDQLDLTAWSALEMDLPEDAVISTALERRFDHLTVLDRVADAERFVMVAANRLEAGLDLSLTATSTSPEGRPATFRGSGTNVSLGVLYDAPLARLPERNVYRAELIGLAAAKRAAVESADTIRTDLRDSLRGLRAARETYAIQTNAVALAERRVESAQLNLEAGRASTRDVLEATEDLVGARNAATSALTDYILSGLALYRDMELLKVEGGRIEIDTEPLAGPDSSTP